MRLLVTGANGQIGWELTRSLASVGEVVGLDRQACDLTRPDGVREIIRRIRPDVIVNAAAYTAVDRAEGEEELATLVNGTAVGVLAEEAGNSGALLIHYSTDYVFDGTKKGPYLESDPPCPISAYGRSKLAGELAIRKRGDAYLILRTTWIYAARGHNFLRTVLRLARDKDELRIVADQIGAPTWARTVADATADIIRKSAAQRADGSFSSGLFHLTASGNTSWHGFAAAILDHAERHALLPARRRPHVHAISTEEYPLPAARPKNSQLAGGSLMQRFGIALPDWRHALSLCFEEMQPC